jgi:hypothetical protein
MLCISPIFKKRKWGREPGFLSPKFRFLEFGGGRRGSFIDLTGFQKPVWKPKNRKAPAFRIKIISYWFYKTLKPELKNYDQFRNSEP